MAEIVLLWGLVPARLGNGPSVIRAPPIKRPNCSSCSPFIIALAGLHRDAPPRSAFFGFFTALREKKRLCDAGLTRATTAAGFNCCHASIGLSGRESLAA